MGQALYRKYRSKSLGEIVGQKPVTTALANALKKGRISHAYLFTGPRGVGKTSVARILAYQINDIPYLDDNLPIDIIEIDAASNRRIDEIRDLREKVRIAPVSAKYKVYIIDEVHMLTREAFNALLKTLEEPPAHVVFILATTEAHKLPETITSRTQHYNFKLISTNEVADHLKQIAKLEAITIDDESLQIIARHSGGSLRDALSLLDQIRHSSDKIEASLVMQNFGLPANDLTIDILKAINEGEPSTIIELLQKARDNGVSATLIAEQLIQDIRDKIINKDSLLPINEAIDLTQSLLQVESSNRPDIMLEIALINAQLASQPLPKAAVSSAKIDKLNPPITISEPAIKLKKAPVIPEQPASPLIIKNATKQPITAEMWATALEQIKLSHNTLYGIIRMAGADYSKVDQNQFTLLFKFPFHQKRIKEPKNKLLIANTLKSLGATNFELNFELMSKNEREEQPAFESNKNEPQVIDTPSASVVDQIINIFGGGEVLE